MLLRQENATKQQFYKGENFQVPDYYGALDQPIDGRERFELSS